MLEASLPNCVKISAVVLAHGRKNDGQLTIPVAHHEHSVLTCAKKQKAGALNLTQTRK